MNAATRTLLTISTLVLLIAAQSPLPAQTDRRAWLQQWEQSNRTWRAMHLIGPRPERLELTKRFIGQVLAPMGMNVLILEVNYGFEFQSHPELECRGLSREQARELAQWCRKHGIRLIPLFNCVGHQSWGKNTFALLRKYPQFDETPELPPDNEGIYCREWCPTNTDVDGVVFDLLDELIDAFDADALHVGMDEVFLIGSPQCPRCRGKDPGELLAGAISRLHRHLVEEKGVEMLMWGDRLLDAERFSYGKWEASQTGSHRAVDAVPKDVIICDWHYNLRDDYPSIGFFQQQGFRVLPATWNNPEAAAALARCARQNATEKMLGILFTGWSAGGNGEYLMAALTDRWDLLGEPVPSERRKTAERIAAAVRSGMKAFSHGNPAQTARVDAIGWHAAGKGGAVAAGGSNAVAAGVQMLLEDGNAADAAAATILALAVTDYGFFAIGGEVPVLVYDAKSGQVKVLSGVGRAPADRLAIEWFYQHGIPSQGSMKAAPVPGAVDLCFTLLRLYGTKSFAEAVAPTLALLDAGGEPWHADLAATFRRLTETEKSTEGTREQKLIAACDRFYRGDIAAELEAWYVETGSFLRRGDLAAHRTLVEDPVSVSYGGYTIHKCGPWTQGPMLCQTLRLLEGFDLRQMGHLSADYIHTVVESLKLAFADRDQYYADPLFVQVPLEQLLSDRYAAIRRGLIDPRSASLERRPGDPRGMKPLLIGPQPGEPAPPIPTSDTTTCVVADRWGNVVAATPSCNLLSNRPGSLGITQGNRLRCLNTTPGHPNRIEPGKRPRITLTPTLVTKDGKPVAAVSVAGGDLQDQTTLNVLLNWIQFGMSPAEAVTAPRWATSHHENSFDPNPDRQAAFLELGGLQLNEAVPEAVRNELAARGHRISTTAKPIAHPVMLLIDQATGVIHAAGDPKADRHAAAID